MNLRIKTLATALVVVPVFMAAFVDAALAQGKSPAKPPRLIIDNMKVQLGERIEGQDFRHTFHIKNTGEGELQIVSVRPG
jgi:hypothetical protein